MQLRTTSGCPQGQARSTICPEGQVRGEAAELRARAGAARCPQGQARGEAAELRARVGAASCPQGPARGEAAELRARAGAASCPQGQARGEAAELRARAGAASCPQGQVRAGLWLALALVGACTPGAGLVFETPATDTWTGGLGGSTGDAGEDGGEAGTGLPPPGPPGPPTTDPTATSATSATSATTDATMSGGEDSSDPGGVPALFIPAQADGWLWHTGAAPAGDWRAPEFDASAWSSGQAPLLTGAPLAATDGIVRLRRGFEIPGDPAGVSRLMLYVRRDDGATVFLNGQELARSGLPIGGWGEALQADAAATGTDAERYFRAVVPADALRQGENVVAVGLHGRGADATRGFDMQLEVLDLSREPTDRMSVQVRTHTYGGEYGDDHVLAIWVEKAGTFVKSLAVFGSERRDNLVAWNAAADGNTVDAVSGATRKRHGTHVVAWDLTDQAGQPAAPGMYTLRVEFTEDDSNSGAPAGPNVAVPFELGGGAKVVPVASDPRFRDWLVIAP